jgi:hypothetical protein
MIYADTGYFIAVLNPRDQLHARAVAWSLHLHEPVLVSEYVAWETMNYFSQPIDRPKAHYWLDQIRPEFG